MYASTIMYSPPAYDSDRSTPVDGDLYTGLPESLELKHQKISELMKPEVLQTSETGNTDSEQGNSQRMNPTAKFSVAKVANTKENASIISSLSEYSPDIEESIILISDKKPIAAPPIHGETISALNREKLDDQCTIEAVQFSNVQKSTELGIIRPSSAEVATDLDSLEPSIVDEDLTEVNIELNLSTSSSSDIQSITQVSNLDAKPENVQSQGIGLVPFKEATTSSPADVLNKEETDADCEIQITKEIVDIDDETHDKSFVKLDRDWDDGEPSGFESDSSSDSDEDRKENQPPPSTVTELPQRAAANGAIATIIPSVLNISESSGASGEIDIKPIHEL